MSEQTGPGERLGMEPGRRELALPSRPPAEGSTALRQKDQLPCGLRVQ